MKRAFNFLKIRKCLFPMRLLSGILILLFQFPYLRSAPLREQKAAALLFHECSNLHPAHHYYLQTVQVLVAVMMAVNPAAAQKPHRKVPRDSFILFADV